MQTKNISRRFSRFLRANEAVSALEYAVLVGVVVLGVGGAIMAFSDSVESAIGAIGTTVTNTGTGLNALNTTNVGN